MFKKKKYKAIFDDSGIFLQKNYKIVEDNGICLCDGNELDWIIILKIN